MKLSVDKLNTSVRNTPSLSKASLVPLSFPSGLFSSHFTSPCGLPGHNPFLLCSLYLFFSSFPLTEAFRHLFSSFHRRNPRSLTFSLSWSLHFARSLLLSSPLPHFLVINNLIQEETGVLALGQRTSLDAGLWRWGVGGSQRANPLDGVGVVGCRHTWGPGENECGIWRDRSREWGRHSLSRVTWDDWYHSLKMNLPPAAS